MTKTTTLSAVCSDLGGPSSVEMRHIDLPPLEAIDIQIEVKAAALNFPDLLMTYGKYQFRPQLPFVIGMEGAGEIVAVGSNAKRFQIGDRVMFKGKTGACSDYINVDQKQVEPLPSTLSFVEGAAFGVTFHTAYVSLVKRGQLKAGETLLVHGAGGGVGQAAVAVGKALGAKVFATASSSEKLSVAKESGADYLINYADVNFSKEIMRKTNGNGVDVILDPVGGKVLDSSVFCLAWNGRLLTVGFASGDFGNISLLELQKKGGSLVGVRAGEYGRRNPEAGRIAYDELTALTIQKNLRPWIGRVWEQVDVAQALRAMEDRGVFGKQVISLNGGQSG
ncbi:MAG: NADPH:quinone oxidoreductase family protein [Sneathiella sp.]|nr:NADPH:quinone oxidoreductase family protein [Sneathiella sp.]